MARFQKWIEDQGGVGPVARKLGMNYLTVYWWTKRRSHPTGPTMVKLVRLGRGAFAFEDIIRDTEKIRGREK